MPSNMVQRGLLPGSRLNRNGFATSRHLQVTVCAALFFQHGFESVTQSSHSSRLRANTAARQRWHGSAHVLALLTVLLFAYFPQPAHSQGNADAEQVMQALRAKDYPTAVSAADAALASHPEDCRIFVMRGMALR